MRNLKRAMSLVLAAAMLISARITGREDPDGAVFSPRRFKLPAAGANLTDGKGVAAVWTVKRFGGFSWRPACLRRTASTAG